MKFNIILIFLLSSCVSNNSLLKNKSSFSAKGFAYIYSDYDYENKITSKKFDSNELLIGHSFLRPGSIVKIMNPENKKFLKLKVKKQTKYPDFYVVLITEEIANRIELNKNVPYVEINELKRNKSFVASKAETFKEEKKVFNKAPVTTVKIDNISTNQKLIKEKPKKFSIIIANFYTKNSAILLKNKLNKELTNLTSKNLFIIKRGKNSFELITDSYNTINSLKNDYIVLKNHGFEQLDIKANE